MKVIATRRLQATAGTQGTWTVPTTAVRIELVNHSNFPIRWAFVTGKVNASPLSFPYEYETLPPMQLGEAQAHIIGAGGGTLYYTSNGLNALFTATAFRN